MRVRAAFDFATILLSFSDKKNIEMSSPEIQEAFTAVPERKGKFPPLLLKLLQK
jgi:hypothetical protein